MTYALLAAMLTLMPIAIMTGQALPSPIFYISLAFGLMILAQHRCAGVGKLLHTYGWVMAGVALPLASVLFSSAWHGFLADSDLEIVLRFLLGILVLTLAADHVPRDWLLHALWGYLAATIAAAAYITYLSGTGFVRPDTDSVYNAVGYGNLTLLLAVIAVFSIPCRLTARPGAERAVKLLVALLGLLAFVLTQTRTGWLAIPIFAVIGAELFVSVRRPRHITMAAVAVIAAMMVVFASSADLRERAVKGYQEAVACQGDHSTEDTSICIRLQLWRASLHMLENHPIAGSGHRAAFNDYLNNVALPNGVVSPHVAKGWGEPHNDLLLALTSYGIPGGLGLLLIYFGPAWIFFRRLVARHPATVRAAAAMGLALCLGFFVFGWAETMWRGMRTVSFYAMCVALFLTLSDPVKYARERKDGDRRPIPPG